METPVMARSGCLGLDIGGANLKAADGRGHVVSRYFPLWRRPEDLASQLRALIAEAGDPQAIVATMTGELADCYATKRDGVAHIVGQLASVTVGRRVWIYRSDGHFVATTEALRDPLRVAAANWSALASFACRFVPSGSGLLVDVGSTTADIVPLHCDRPMATAWTDPERLVCRELVYTGVLRSPVCALVDALPWRGTMCPTAQELFATTGDAYVLLGHLPEDGEATDTADGRGRTRSLALDRLARSICADRELYSMEDALAAAQTIHQAQLERLASALCTVIERMPSPPRTVVASGQGEFLVQPLTERLGMQARIISLTDMLGPEVSRVATCYALVVLATEAGLS